jgi:hypothetical protein
VTVDLRELTRATFERLVGSDFRVLVDETRSVSVKLVQCSALPPASQRADAAIRAEPFSLLFKGSQDLVLEQQIYRLEHSDPDTDLGSLELFLVPVGFGESEAVFN